MTEPMSEERLTRLASDNEPRGDHLSGLTADEVGELLDEVERLRDENAQLYGHLTAEINISKEATRRLEEATRERDEYRAQLAEIGETREEWYVRWPTAGGRYTYELCEDEQDAREAIPDDDDTCEIVKRFVGGWQQVER